MPNSVIYLVCSLAHERLNMFGYEKIDFIISSDFFRTKETAEIVKKGLDLSDDQLVFDKRLWELGRDGL